MLYLKREVNVFFIFLIAIFLMINAKSSSAVECGSVPTDNCDVTQNTAFAQGNYSLPNGINIKASNIVLDCNNSILSGSGIGLSKGIEIYGDCNFNMITNCNISNFNYGIFLSEGASGSKPDFNKIIKNTLKNNTYGIYLFTNADYTNITQNLFRNNSHGLYIASQSSNSNNIWNNTVYDSIAYLYTGDHQYVINGVGNTYLDGATGPTTEGLYIYNGLNIDSNRIYAPGVYHGGVHIRGSGITFDCNNSITLDKTGTSAYQGIEIQGDFNSNTIKNCNITNFNEGIVLLGTYFGGPDYTKITGNILERNSYGIDLVSKAKYTNITQNTFKNNSYGLYLPFSAQVDYNNIWNNDFVNNTISQAYDFGTGNNWNSSGEGNYWGNYDSEAEGCYDNNSDLSCDIPYNIGGSAGSKDYLSLIGVKVIDILPIQVVKDVDMVKGKTTLVRTTMENVGIYNKNITVKLYFEGNLKDSKNDIIAAGQNKYVDLFFQPDIAGNNKNIKIEVKENK